MKIQYISDHQGKTTGVFIPIEEWNKFKNRFKNIEEFKIPKWQVEESRMRLDDYAKNPEQALDFDQVIKEIEEDL